MPQRRPDGDQDGAGSGWAAKTTVSEATDDPGLFDVAPDGRVVLPEPTTALAERDAGVRRVNAASDDQARAVCDHNIHVFAESGRPFSANNFRHLLPAERSGLIGARFLAAAKRGEIVRVGYEPATHAAGHGRPVALWAAAPTYSGGVR